MTTEQPADTRDMVMAHDMFRREIGQAPALVLGVAAGDVERAGIVAGHITLVDSILHHHHHAEDIGLWPMLRSKAGAEVEPIVRTMEGQHEAIEKINAEVTAGLASWPATADPGEAAALADALRRLHDAIVEHLALEEEQVLPLIERHMNAAEWHEVVSGGAGEVPPERMALVFGLTVHQADPDVVREVVSHMPPEIGPTIVDTAAKAFAEHAERVYGTATPAY
ncbi:MAG TPA: hemerythrin domain-containing protein [Pseudonocardiaceae bacterium]|jgi:hypothetical protein|nr:hemerythrin domain-containing protein [Pseudonocardiaceae bacterium]